MKKLTNNQVVEKLKEHYADKFQYDKVNYVNSRSYTTLTCPLHGDFEVYGNNALKGKAVCPKCTKVYSNEAEFIEEAEKRFPNRFIYDKVHYTNKITPVTIICKKHGEFEQQPRLFLQSKFGCAQCYQESRVKEKPKKLTSEETRLQKQKDWIQYCSEIHNNKYDYSKVNYVSAREKVEIICPLHGSFYQAPYSHKYGIGCPKCARELTKTKTIKSQEQFEKEARAIHGDLYEYGQYNGMQNNMTIICKQHGPFTCTPHNHIYGKCGCPICKASHGKVLVYNWLTKNGIPFMRQYPLIIDNQQLYLDFYVKCNDNIHIIEYNGIQHYLPVEHFGGKLRLEKQQVRDQYLRDYCKCNNIRLLEIPYTLSDTEVVNKLNEFINGQIQEQAFMA